MRKQFSFRPIGISILCAAAITGIFYFIPNPHIFLDPLLRLSVRTPSTQNPFTGPKQPTVDAQRLQQLNLENEELRNVLKFYKRVSYPHVEANVLSRDPFSASIVYIDAGSKDGVSKGQAVIFGDGFLVGTIIQSSPSRSAISLITNNASRIAASTLGSAETKGIVRGFLDSSLHMEFLRDKSSAAVGDTVVTSGLEGQIPPGLILGSVQEITPSEDTLFFKASVQPIIDMSKLTVVSVITTAL